MLHPSYAPGDERHGISTSRGEGVIGIFPLAAAVVAGVFCAALIRQYAARRRAHQLLWAIAMAMYAVASSALFAGAVFGWTVWWFAAYWLFGAVLTVPFLAGGELLLLFRGWPAVVMSTLFLGFLSAIGLVVIFGWMAWFTSQFGGPGFPRHINVDLPPGAVVFFSRESVLVLARVSSYSAYAFLLFGTLWSAWKMRGAPELRDRFWGTLLIALGATIVAGGSAFAAAGILIGFSLTLLAGITGMFLGFLKASGPIPAAAAHAEQTA